MRLLAWLLVLAGMAGFAVESARVPAGQVRQRAEGSFWSATDAGGATLSVARNLGGVTLQGGDSLRLDGLPADARWTGLGLELQSLARGATIEVTLGAGTGGELVLAVVPDEPVGVFLVRRAADGTQAILARAQLAQLLKNVSTPFRLRVQRDGPRCEFLVNGTSAFTTDAAELGTGVPAIAVRGGAAAVRHVLVEAAAVDPGGAPRSWQEDFRALSADTPWSARSTGLGLALAALLAAAVLLSALCRSSPPPRQLADALAMFAAPVAAACAVQPFLALPHDVLVPLVAALALAGLLAALWRLRSSLHAAGSSAPATARRWLLACVVAACTLGLVLRLALAGELAEVRAFQAAQLAARDAPLPPPWALVDAAHLDAGNALVVPGAWRDFELTARVTLDSDSVLELRTRAAPPPAAQGMALWLSSDPAVASTFVRESAADCAPCGTSAAPIAAGASFDLHLALRGESLHADVGGRPLDVTSCHGTGSALVLLATRGSATVASLKLTAARPDGDASPPGGAWATACLVPLLFLLLAAAALARCLALPAPAALQLAALALLPLAAALPALVTDGDGHLLQLERAAFGMAALLALPVCVHARRLAAPTLLAWLLLAPLLAALTVGALAADRRLVRGVVPDGFDAAAWSGTRLPEEQAFWRHPLLRLLNDYVGDHRFRGREVHLEKPPGTARVIALGGSSTWGFGLAPELGAEYPAVLQRLLDAESPGRVEVLNAAWRGATGARLLRFLRDGLAPFAPDVVTLSLTYNDSFALTRADEDAWLAAPGAAGFAPTVLDVLRESRALQRGNEALSRLLVASGGWQGSTRELWARQGEPADPPARFEAILRQFAGLAQQRGFRLVLVKEPVAGDGRLIWKDEFRAAIDRVGADCGLAVVDPTPALQLAGGDTLFQDQVHPRPAGHEIIARALLPAVRAALGR